MRKQNGNRKLIKFQNAVLVTLLIHFLVSCEDPDYVRFESPQPIGVNETKAFNRKTKGEYINCLNSNDQIVITEDLIVNQVAMKFKVHRNDLEFDSTANIDKNSDQEISTIFRSEGYEIEIDGDTINAKLSVIDTIFRFNENEMLKKYRGSYLLNFRRTESHWDVYRLSLKKDTLLFGQISPSDSLLRFDFVSKKVESIDSGQAENTEYTIKPTRREFRKLMKSNSFETCSCYIKMKD